MSHGGDGAILVARPHGEFVAIELAQSDCACLRQAAHHRRVKRRTVALEHARTGGGWKVLGDKDVLVGQGHAFERGCTALGQARIGRAGLRQGGFFVPGYVGAQCVVLLAALQKILRCFNGADLAVPQCLGELLHGQVVQ